MTLQVSQACAFYFAAVITAASYMAILLLKIQFRLLISKGAVARLAKPPRREV